MNSFEVFCLLYFALDDQWRKTPSEDLVGIISDMNPFVWTDIVSADPAEYDDFQKAFLNNQDRTDYCYDFVCSYIEQYSGFFKEGMKQGFRNVTRENWIAAAKKYLASPHKGDDLVE